MSDGRTTVVSSNILSVGYDDNTETLEVEFVHGGVYQYYGVPETVYRELMQAPSKGQYLNAYIKDRYPYSRVG